MDARGPGRRRYRAIGANDVSTRSRVRVRVCDGKFCCKDTHTQKATAASSDPTCLGGIGFRSDGGFAAVGVAVSIERAVAVAVVRGGTGQSRARATSARRRGGHPAVVAAAAAPRGSRRKEMDDNVEKMSFGFEVLAKIRCYVPFWLGCDSFLSSSLFLCHTQNCL